MARPINLRCFSISALLAFLVVSSGEGQDRNSGSLGGKVVDDLGRPVAGALVTLVGRNLSVYSGSDGSYEFKVVPPGPVVVSVRRIGFQIQEIKGLVVSAGSRLEVPVVLQPASVSLEEVTVTGTRERSSVAAAVLREEQLPQVADIIAAEQISLSPDGNAAEAIRRVSGVTLMDDKFAVVRGLNHRYTAASLNGMRLPSPEPEKRRVPLDLFPADLLDAIETSKSFVPEQPGDATGGAVNLVTREATGRRFWSWSMSVSSNTAGWTRLPAPPAERWEWLGLASDKRNLPEPVRNAGTLQGLRQSDIPPLIGSFRRVWSPEFSRPRFGGSFGTSHGSGFSIGGTRVDYLGALTYGYGHSIRRDERRALAVAGEEGTRPQNQYQGSTVQAEATWGGMLNLTARFGERGRIALNSAGTLSGENSATRLVGDNEEFGVNLELTRLSYVQRTASAHQLSGQQWFGSSLRWDWNAGVSTVARSEPDRSDLAYELLAPNSGGSRWFGVPRSATRTFSQLDETAYDVGSSLSHLISLGSAELSLRIGAAYRTVSREADSRSYDILNLGLTESERQMAPETLFSGERLSKLGLMVNALGGRYSADQDNTAAYLQAELTAGRWRLLTGARVERDLMKVNSLGADGRSVTGGNAHTDILPALTAKWNFSPRQSLRLSLARTVSRPEYRELSPVSYFEVLGGLIVFGNPELDRSLVWNAELRWEWRSESGVSGSIGAFGKRFEKPIEEIIIGTTGASALSFVNAEGAHSTGLEVDLRAPLGQAGSPLTLFANGSLVSSSVTPGSSGLSSLTSPRRSMVGQAPYTANVGILYYGPSGLSASLLLNAVGARIVEAGVIPLPDTYARPDARIDFSLRAPVGRSWFLNLDAVNLTDSPHRVFQGSVERSHHRSGRKLSVGIGYKP